MALKCVSSSLADQKTQDDIPFSVGDQFHGYQELEIKINVFQERNGVQLWKRDSRTITAAARRSDKLINQSLEYSELCFCCINGGKSTMAKEKEFGKLRKYIHVV